MIRAGIAALLALVIAGCGGDDERFDVLVYSRTTAGAFRHGGAIEAGRAALARMGEEQGFAVEATDDPAALAGLDEIDVVVLLHTNGEGVVPRERRAGFERWFRAGGGVVAIHAAANADRGWAFYGELLGGARFRNHPPGELQFQRATVHRRAPDHPAMRPLPREWTRTDEWYEFAPGPGPAAHVLATLDEREYEEADGTPAADPHPIAWTARVDRGRSLYTALGHRAAAWDERLYRAHVLGAVEWAARP